MDITLKVTPDVLRRKSTEVYKEVQEIERGFGEIERYVQNSRYYWEGDASSAHQRLFNSYKDEIQEIIRRLKEHPVDLQKMAEVYDEASMKALEAASSLSGDVIE